MKLKCQNNDKSSYCRIDNLFLQLNVKKSKFLDTYQFYCIWLLAMSFRIEILSYLFFKCSFDFLKISLAIGIPKCHYSLPDFPSPLPLSHPLLVVHFGPFKGPCPCWVKSQTEVRETAPSCCVNTILAGNLCQSLGSARMVLSSRAPDNNLHCSTTIKHRLSGSCHILGLVV